MYDRVDGTSASRPDSEFFFTLHLSDDRGIHRMRPPEEMA
ncbi:hypothetical protein CW298_2053 [Salmonella enterica subsp. enterica serovar Muenchen]|nr:hypothetical protein SeH_A3064 [Salmonella enterica subsp. enterica serovar Hadar str. RI_05P066]EHC48645.1 hypothetical protein LTSEHVI_3529 [Salmonella enterica subsp. enterica serovar Hvittingfoss str. A4-620]PQB17696.1 hypothetical protein CW298_2053 [Salmonella enterica subsp. enterica serovar Muenchen]CEH22624.1 FIG01045786: hypothetical protein [Salmonella enterica subsp. enterica serovar Manhattan str. 111113]